MLNDMNSQRQASYNYELNSQDMQRYLVQLENDKLALRQQVSDWQREADIAKKQTELEKQRCAELERVVANERRNLHSRDLDTSAVLRENDDLKADVERMQLRIQSLQSHIDSLQKYNGGGSQSDDREENSKMLELEAQLQEAQMQVTQVEDLRNENIQLVEYV